MSEGCQNYVKLTMDKTRAYIFPVWLLYLICCTCGLDVKTEVGPIQYGEKATLKCILPPPNTAVQVTWTKIVGDTETIVATYKSDSGAEISKGHKDRLQMSTSNLNETAITVYKTGIQDEGCYICNFYSPTKEPKKGEVCLSIPGDILIEKNYRVELFQAVTLKCIKKDKKENAKVIQISWMKNGKNIATYKDEEYIDPEYRGLISLTMEGWDVSSLTVFKANVSDEGKYSCVFNNFPGGAETGETFLHIYGPLNVTVSKTQVADSLTITCVAKSWPPSTIFWLDVDEGSLNGTTYDGYLTNTSWIQIYKPDSQQMKMPKCKVVYLGNETLFSVSAGTQSRLHPVLLGLLVCKMLFI